MPFPLEVGLMGAANGVSRQVFETHDAAALEALASTNR
jgi:hypothetical protein